ncbi:MAG TPA: hypothetical protein VG225_03565 [Terracidiphilus sp.]|nr:hypothetical protein [Terracidiphilus sp.]
MAGIFSDERNRAFFPRDCFTTGIEDLTLGDFRLFQDGKLEQIKSMDKESWWMPVRDQPATEQSNWHLETSDTPSGFWSSAVIDGNRVQPTSEHFYLLSYAPDTASLQRGCHRLRVEVSRPGAEVFARNEYCAGETHLDLLNGTKVGEKLEHELAKTGPEKIPVFVQVGAMQDGAGRRKRAEVAVEFPWDLLNRSWDIQTGRLYASIGILGAVYSKDGKLAARFSDLLWPSWWPTIIQGWQEDTAIYFGSAEDDSLGFGGNGLRKSLSEVDVAWLPTRYETQFELEPGEYTLRVVLSDGIKVGRTEVPLTVEDDDEKSLALSSVFLCTRFRDAHVAAVETAAANFAPQYVPLVSKGVQFIPAAKTNLAPDEHLFAYFQIDDSGLAAEPAARIQAHLRIVDAKSSGLVKDFPPVDAATYEQPGSTLIPIAREIPIANLPKGPYRLEVQASDASGRATAWHTAGFSIE